MPPTALPVPLVSQPIPFVKPPTIPIPFPKSVNAGPAPAVNAAHLRTFLCSSSDMELKCLAISASMSIQGFPAFRPSRRAFKSGPPNSIAKSVTWFLNIFNCDSVVSYRLLASFVRAVFSFQALFERATAALILSDDKARDLSMFPCLIPVMPNFIKIASIFAPCSRAVLRPLIKACKASAGFSFQAFWNSSDVVPATLAIKARSSAESLVVNETALPIAVRVCVIAVPPASASIPTELIAVARPRISGAVRPANLPPAAKRLVISTMSRSVVAKLLPKSTTDDPNRLYSSDVKPRIFAILAIAVAASSALKFVDSPMSIIVREKVRISSALMPNWPATSATFAISTALAGNSLAI